MVRIYGNCANILHSRARAPFMCGAVGSWSVSCEGAAPGALLRDGAPSYSSKEILVGYKVT